MYKIVIVVLLIVLIVIGVEAITIHNPKISNSHSSTPTITNITVSPTTSKFCKSSDLDAKIITEGAAGSIYANLTIKNISDKNCDILGNNFVIPTFNTKNIKIVNQGQAGSTTLTLLPNTTVYLQIHYPNGPQCNGPIIETGIFYTYKISPEDSIVFKDRNGKTNLTIGVCNDATLTNLDVWSTSLNPISL